MIILKWVIAPWRPAISNPFSGWISVSGLSLCRAHPELGPDAEKSITSDVGLEPTISRLCARGISNHYVTAVGLFLVMLYIIKICLKQINYHSKHMSMRLSKDSNSNPADTRRWINVGVTLIQRHYTYIYHLNKSFIYINCWLYRTWVVIEYYVVMSLVSNDTTCAFFYICKIVLCCPCVTLDILFYVTALATYHDGALQMFFLIF